MTTQDDKFARLSKRSADSQVAQPTADVVVRPDEGGEALAATLEGAQDGQVIRIGAGTYRTSRPVKMTRSLTLVGDGKATTRVVSSAPGDCFKFVGPSECSATSISFEHEGDTVGNVVKVDARKAVFKKCRFVGARHINEECEDQGSGLTVVGRSEACCEECEAAENQGAGIAFSDETTGNVTSCTATRNLAGFAAGGRTSVVLRANSASQNGMGIGVGGNATAEVSRNDCCGNQAIGIVVAENASPTLSWNTLERNKRGIVFGQLSSGSALHNTCRRNGIGIEVRDEAHPVIDRNRCENNEEGGIGVRGNAVGTLRSNECNNNLSFGIAVTDQAHPVVERNTCTNNGEIGIIYADRSTGICRGNKVEENPENVVIQDHASPQLEDENHSPVSVSAASGNASSNSGDCFVATATYGTPIAPEVRRFRAYRDQVLARHVVGRAFVRIYYVLGPRLAAIIRRQPGLRRLSAALLGRLAGHLPN